MPLNSHWTSTCNLIFPTPLFNFQLNEYATLNQHLLEAIYQIKQTDPGLTLSNSLGWHSSVNLLTLPSFQTFKSLIEIAVAEVATTIGYQEVQIVAEHCWANVGPQYASHRAHQHPNCLLSGVYYVKVPLGAGNIVFYDPRSARTFYQPQTKTPTPYTVEAIDLTPEEGNLLIFPSWLIHSVEPNLSQDDRVSISFNYTFR